METEDKIALLNFDYEDIYGMTPDEATYLVSLIKKDLED